MTLRLLLFACCLFFTAPTLRAADRDDHSLLAGSVFALPRPTPATPL